MSLLRNVLAPVAVAVGVGYAARERARRRVVSLARPSEATGATEREPVSPLGEPVEPWSPILASYDLAEDSLRQDNLALLPWAKELTGPTGTRLDLPAVLVLDPVDGVAALVEGRHVGTLSAQDAARFGDAIAAAAPDGQGVRVPSTQWTRSLPGLGRYGVTVQLPHPAGMTPANGLPPGAVALPSGGPLQVTQTEEQAAQARAWMGRAVAASLHTLTRRTGLTERRVIEVRVDGEPLGELTSARSGALADLVEAVEDGGGVPVARAIVREVSGAVDLTLYVTRVGGSSTAS